MARPSKYREEYCQMIVNHMKKGLSKEAFAAEISVSKQRIYDWMRLHEEFRDAVYRGEAASLCFWEKKGIEGLYQGSKFNEISWIFNMRNRFGWKNS